MSYQDKWNHPKWQKKRLEVFQRDDFKCLGCKSEEDTLQVHHLIYTTDDPWDEPSEHLETLCYDCHQWREDWDSFWGGKSLIPTWFCITFKIFWKRAYSGAYDIRGPFPKDLRMDALFQQIKQIRKQILSSTIGDDKPRPSEASPTQSVSPTAEPPIPGAQGASKASVPLVTRCTTGLGTPATATGDQGQSETPSLQPHPSRVQS